MTIYEDGTEKEQVKLYSLKTKEEMHKVMQEKGFKKKSVVVKEEKRIVVESSAQDKSNLRQQEVVVEKKDETSAQQYQEKTIHQVEKEIIPREEELPTYSSAFKLYGIIGGVTLAFVFLVKSRRKRKPRGQTQ